MRNLILTLLILLYFKANALTDTLFINKEEVVINNVATGLCSFNDSANFSTHNKHISLNISDSLVITIINNDSLDHTFTILGLVENNNVIAGFASKTFTVNFNEAGTYRYYSDKAYGSLIGASGIISVVNSANTHYYWNLFEVESTLSLDLASENAQSIPVNYQPNIFTINGHHYPNTITDSTARVIQSVGDSIYISIINSGNIDHILHFHGYHVKLLDLTINKSQTNWIKDTFPVKKGEAMTILLVPDKTGIYPVHDHNLINITNSGSYPGGMLTNLLIQ